MSATVQLSDANGIVRFEGTMVGGESAVSSLSGALAVGAQAATLASAPPLGFSSRAAVIAIGVGDASCELRRVTGVSGARLTLDRALANAHATDSAVLLLLSNAIPLWGFGAVGNQLGGTEVNAEPAVQAAINECVAADVWLDGMNARYILNGPLVLPQSAKVRSVQKFKAGVAYAPTGTGDWMMMTCQDTPQSFTVDTGTDTFTTPAAHSIGGVGNMIVFKGTALPAPLVSGRIYYVKTIPTTTTFTISATDGGATLDITTAGTAPMTMYPDVAALEKAYLTDVRVDGANIAQNGFLGALQQPHEGSKVYFEHFLKTGVKLWGQQFSMWNLISISSDIGLELGDAANACFEAYFYGLNVEGCTTAGIRVTNAEYCGVWGLHAESQPTHIHFPAGADVRSFTIDTAILPVSATMVGVLCESGFASYELRSSSPYGGTSSDVFINDTARGYSLTKADYGEATQSTEAGFFQPYGATAAPVARTPRVLAKTAAYTAKPLDDVILCNATGGAFTVSLPSAALKGMTLTVKKTDASANAVTVDPSGAQTIDGAATSALAAQYDSLTIVSDGANWMTV